MTLANQFGPTVGLSERVANEVDRIALLPRVRFFRLSVYSGAMTLASRELLYRTLPCIAPPAPQVRFGSYLATLVVDQTAEPRRSEHHLGKGCGGSGGGR